MFLNIYKSLLFNLASPVMVTAKIYISSFLSIIRIPSCRSSILMLPKNLIFFVLSNCTYILLVPLQCSSTTIFLNIISNRYTCVYCHVSFHFPFGPTFYIYSKFLTLACLSLHIFFIRVIPQSYLNKVSNDFFWDLVFDQHKLIPKCVLFILLFLSHF